MPKGKPTEFDGYGLRESINHPDFASYMEKTHSIKRAQWNKLKWDEMNMECCIIGLILLAVNMMIKYVIPGDIIIMLFTPFV